MTPRLFPLEEMRAWLRFAEQDLRLATLAIEDSPPLAGAALYHAQQAAEKALKGFLVSRSVAYSLTHDLRKLLQLCGEIDPVLSGLLMPAVGLTQFAVRFRYPGEEQPTREEALPWLELARTVFNEVQQRLPADPDQPRL